MRTVKKALLVVGVIVLAVVGVVVYYVANPNLPHYQAPSEVRYLPQWKDEARQRFYYTPQGTLVKGLHYDWFTALELPFSEEPFAAPEYLARFGFLVDPQQKASDLNPGNLPVGFSQHRDEKTGTRYLDITCAACHTGELRYQGKSLRIDGGAAMHSIAATVPTLRGGAFGQALGASMAATYYNPFKFNRFARKVLGERYEQDKSQLRADFKAVLDTLLRTAWNDTRRHLYPTEEGPGRTDAFGRIANSVFGDAIDPGNYRVANAPVSYPQVWDIWKFDWVQWNGSAMQPMARNIGEALGVGARLQIFDEHGQPLRGEQRYASSVRLHDLHALEETLQQLKPPTWPEDLFGRIDLQRASQGRALEDHERLRPTDRRTGTARLQGPPAGRRLGDPAVPAQRLGAQPVPTALPGRRTLAAVLRRHLRIRSEIRWIPHREIPRRLPPRHPSHRQPQQRPRIPRRLPAERRDRPRPQPGRTLGAGGIPEGARQPRVRAPPGPGPDPTLDARPEMPGAGATDRATLNLGNGEARGMAPPPLSTPSSPSPFRGDA